MSLLDRFKALSPSSVALFRNAPAVWACKYLYSVRDESGPAAWRGIAVEAGVTQVIMGGKSEDEALTLALANYELNAQGLADDKADNARTLIGPMLKQALPLFAPRGKPTIIQLKVERQLDGVPLPFVGYCDFVWDGEVVDLKTTERMPSEPKADHAAQVALYCHGTNRTGTLIYVTGKKGAEYKLDADAQKAAIADLTRSAKALCHALSRFNSPEEMARCYAPDFTSFYWSEPTKAKALEIHA